MSHPCLIIGSPLNSPIRQTVGTESRWSAGFTLIELLAVIAIVAILAALLFPTMGLIKDSSQRMACLSNLRTIGAGLASYSAENDGWNPAGYGPRGVWTTEIQDYMPWSYNSYSRLDASRYCPVTSYNGVNDFKRNATQWNTDFGVNAGVLVYNFAYRRTKRATVGSGVIAVFDGYNMGTTDSVAPRHRHGRTERTPDRDYANFLFMGGQVETMTLTEMPKDGDPRWGSSLNPL